MITFTMRNGTVHQFEEEKILNNNIVNKEEFFDIIDSGDDFLEIHTQERIHFFKIEDISHFTLSK